MFIVDEAGFEGEIGLFQEVGFEEEAAVAVVEEEEDEAGFALFIPPNCPRSPNGS